MSRETLMSQIRSEMRTINRAVLGGINGEEDQYAESEWEEIKADIIRLANGIELETACRKAADRAEKIAIRTGEDPEEARERARFEVEQARSKR